MFSKYSLEGQTSKTLNLTRIRNKSKRYANVYLRCGATHLVGSSSF